jgi:hypothetical protein
MVESEPATERLGHCSWHVLVSHGMNEAMLVRTLRDRQVTGQAG